MSGTLVRAAIDCLQFSPEPCGSPECSRKRGDSALSSPSRHRSQESPDSLPIGHLLLQVTVAIHSSVSAVVSSEQANAIQDFMSLGVFDCISQFNDRLPKRSEHRMKGKGSKANNHFRPNNCNLLPQEQ